MVELLTEVQEDWLRRFHPCPSPDAHPKGVSCSVCTFLATIDELRAQLREAQRSARASNRAYEATRTERDEAKGELAELREAGKIMVRDNDRAYAANRSLHAALRAVTIEQHPDGFWLGLEGTKGRQAVLRLETDKPGPIVFSVMQSWQQARDAALSDTAGKGWLPPEKVQSILKALSLAYANIGEDNWRKLDAQAKRDIVVGMEEGSAALKALEEK